MSPQMFSVYLWTRSLGAQLRYFMIQSFPGGGVPALGPTESPGGTWMVQGGPTLWRVPRSCSGVNSLHFSTVSARGQQLA